MKTLIPITILVGALSGAAGSVLTRAFSVQEAQAEVAAIGPASTQAAWEGPLLALQDENQRLQERLDMLEQRPLIAAPTTRAPAESEGLSQVATTELEALRSLATSLQNPNAALPETFVASIGTAMETIREQERQEREDKRAVAEAERMEDRLADLTEKLALTPGQTDQMRTFMTDSADKRRDLFEAARESGDFMGVRESMRDLRRESDTTLSTILDSTQFEQYKASEPRGGGGRFFGGGGGGPAGDAFNGGGGRRRRGDN